MLHRIRGAQSAIVSFSRSEPESDHSSDGLEEFLAPLPRLWESGEARPTHRKTPARPRDRRTRSDPFEGVWAKPQCARELRAKGLSPAEIAIALGVSKMTVCRYSKSRGAHQ